MSTSSSSPSSTSSSHSAAVGSGSIYENFVKKCLNFWEKKNVDLVTYRCFWIDFQVGVHDVEDSVGEVNRFLQTISRSKSGCVEKKFWDSNGSIVIFIGFNFFQKSLKFEITICHIFIPLRNSYVIQRYALTEIRGWRGLRIIVFFCFE